MRAAPSRPLASPHRGATHGSVSMGKRVQLGLRIALVDADALQRACTANSLIALGADVVPFVHLADLVGAFDARQKFDGVVVGLHADARRTLSRVPDLEAAAGRALPLVYVTHRSELQAVDAVPTALRAGRSFQLLCSPVEDAQLLAWLETLAAWGRGTLRARA